MRWKTVVGMLGGAMVVAAACSAQNADQPRGPMKDSGPIDALVDAFRDAFDPSKDVEAGPTDWTTDTLACDKAGLGSDFAEKAFAGRTAADLSRGVATVCFPAEALPGYNCIQRALYVRDGAVAVICNATGSSAKPSTVTVVMPPAI